MKTTKQTLNGILFLWLLTFSVLKLNAQVPSITTFSPTSGNAGTTVTITGTNFSTTPANNVVYFGATRATVVSASATSLQVTSPLGATYATITVINTTTGLTTVSSYYFTPTFSGGPPQVFGR